jgi:hypothetical protein
MNTAHWTILLVAFAIAPAACSPAPAPTSSAANEKSAVAPPSPAPPVVAPVAAPPSSAVTPLPLAIVHKDPNCGCCGFWVDHLKQAGFTVEVRNEANLNPLKERLGVPYGKGSCHTAEVGGYVVEGHVPADDIKRLLREKPDAKGLVLPGMPLGSPGMEVPDGTVQRYTVELVQRDGTTVAYSTHGK